ncbi:hypothetical protein [Halobaculum roseum]|uniref:Uncharacterized protein n=1 Tax=Halobaculum roseum TaxID=2175149 RepID=A0ABD5MMP9_9EURY|nr:hypothetical protein [Halobaculum roseum]QZY04218.1 hypothetical protein K6T36_16010 [Halobaculum roseum]
MGVIEFDQFPPGTKELVAAIAEWKAQKYGDLKRGDTDYRVTQEEFTRRDLANETSLSFEQVRYRLQVLQREGYVKQWKRPGEQGSPEKIYIMTHKLQSHLQDTELQTAHEVSNVRPHELHELVSEIVIIREEIEEFRLRAGLSPHEKATTEENPDRYSREEHVREQKRRRPW